MWIGKRVVSVRCMSGGHGARAESEDDAGPLRRDGTDTTLRARRCVRGLGQSRGPNCSPSIGVRMHVLGGYIGPCQGRRETGSCSLSARPVSQDSAFAPATDSLSAAPRHRMFLQRAAQRLMSRQPNPTNGSIHPPLDLSTQAPLLSPLNSDPSVSPLPQTQTQNISILPHSFSHPILPRHLAFHSSQPHPRLDWPALVSIAPHF